MSLDLSKEEVKLRNSHPLSSNFFKNLRPFQPIVQILAPLEIQSRVTCLRIRCCDATTVFNRIGFRLKFADRIKKDELDKRGNFPKIRILDYRILDDVSGINKTENKVIVITEYCKMEQSIPRNLTAKPFDGYYSMFFHRLRTLIDRHHLPQQSIDPDNWTMGIIQKIGQPDFYDDENGNSFIIRDVQISTIRDDAPNTLRLYENEAMNFKADEGEVIEISEARCEFSPTAYFYHMDQKKSKFALNPMGVDTVLRVKRYHLGAKFETDFVHPKKRRFFIDTKLAPGVRRLHKFRLVLDDDGCYVVKRFKIWEK